MPIINLSRETTIASYVLMADNPLTRMQGLLGRSGLHQGYALVIKPCQSIHMFFMKFSIDVIFIDGENRVVGLVPHIKPFCLSPIFWNASSAVELNAGGIQKSQTVLGDVLEFGGNP